MPYTRISSRIRHHTDKNLGRHTILYGQKSWPAAITTEDHEKTVTSDIMRIIELPWPESHENCHAPHCAGEYCKNVPSIPIRHDMLWHVVAQNTVRSRLCFDCPNCERRLRLKPMVGRNMLHPFRCYVHSGRPKTVGYRAERNHLCLSLDRDCSKFLHTVTENLSRGARLVCQTRAPTDTNLNSSMEVRRLFCCDSST